MSEDPLADLFAKLPHIEHAAPSPPPIITRPELSEPSFRRFEDVIRAACLAYPNAITCTWPGSGLRYSTFVARLRDAIKSFREYNWETVWYHAPSHREALFQLEVRADPSNSSRILVGVPQTQAKALHTRILGEVESVGLLASASQKVAQSNAPTDAGVVVPMSYEWDGNESLVIHYAQLASTPALRNLPKLHIVKQAGQDNNAVLRTLNELVDGYDVAIIDTPTAWIIS